MIYRFFLLMSVPLIAFIAAGCGGTKMVNTATLPDNYQCQHMKEVCKEARTFESAYNKMSAEEKKDAENILKAYRIQCNDALEFCTESAKKK
jgi:hypothetical protein